MSERKLAGEREPVHSGAIPYMIPRGNARYFRRCKYLLYFVSSSLYLKYIVEDRINRDFGMVVLSPSILRSFMEPAPRRTSKPFAALGACPESLGGVTAKGSESTLGVAKG
jgi:hypothetical protein